MVLSQFHDGASPAALWHLPFRHSSDEGLRGSVERNAPIGGTGGNHWSAISVLLGEALLLLDTRFGLYESGAIPVLADGI